MAVTNLFTDQGQLAPTTTPKATKGGVVNLFADYQPSPKTTTPKPTIVKTSQQPVIGKVLDFAKSEQVKSVVASAKTIFDNIKKAVSKYKAAGENINAPIGRAMQKVPNVDLGTKTKNKFSVAPNTEEKIVNFISNFPSAIIQGYGRSLEQVSSDKGRAQLKTDAKNLPKTMSEVKTLIEKKEWQKALQTAMSNTAFTVALDASDFISVGLITKGVKAIRAIKTSERQVAKTIVKEAIQEAEEQVVKNVDTVIKPKPKTIVKSEVKPDITKGVEKVVEETGVDIDLVKEAIQSGDIKAAKALYDDLPKGTYKSSFESIQQSVVRGEARQGAALANEGVQAVKETYGQYQGVVQKMKNFLRISAEKKNSEGTLFREHIPKKNFGISSDEIATDLGMSENKLMEKMLSELDIQKKPVPKAAKDVSVARSELPVGEGKEKISRLEARVTKSLNKAPQEIKDQLGSTYTQMNKKENIAKASRYITEKPDEAMAVLRGEKEAPSGILKNSIYVAMENEAKGNVELARKLASLRSTRAGQELSILTEIDPNSPVKQIRDIIVVREEAFKKRYSGRSVKEVTDKVVSDIKKKVKVPDKYDWGNFIKSLPTC